MSPTIPFLICLQITITICNPIIDLPNGKIRGRQDQTIQNSTYYAFEQIPYATPPVGELRFKPPQPPNNWEGILDTQRMNKICYQLTRKGPETENCLYLNVFTPQLPTKDKHPSLPVMFYIHGGGFYDGTARVLGPDRFVDNGVIYVAVNYRLGPFGFLSTGDVLIHGNNGLKDQLLALQWVHDNIEFFGGDPDRVTIFGHSSGAASVGYFLLNKKAEGLFSAAISQSGTVLGPWALQRKPRETVFNFARFLDTTFEEGLNDSVRLVKYLQKAPAEELKKASYNYYFNYIFEKLPEDLSILQGLYFGPVIEVNSTDAFITDKMYKLLKKGDFIKVPLMIGFTTEECLEYYRDYNRSVKVLKLYDDNLDWLVPQDMDIKEKVDRIKMGQSIRKIYTEGRPFSENVKDGLRFSSDNLITRPTLKQAELYSNFAKTYFYVFSYDGDVGGISTHYDGVGKVGHGEENMYLVCSGSKCDLSKYPKNDQLTQKRLIKLWTDFAKHKNPTPVPSSLLDNITWPPLSTENGDYLYVDIDVKLTIKNHPDETYQKWKELYESLGHEDFDTY